MHIAQHPADETHALPQDFTLASQVQSVATTKFCFRVPPAERVAASSHNQAQASLPELPKHRFCPGFHAEKLSVSVFFLTSAQHELHVNVNL